MSSTGKANRILQVAAILSAAAILAADLRMELGVATAVAYLVPVWLVHRAGRADHTIWAAAICTALTILGYLHSPSGGEPLKVYANRALSLIAVWITAYGSVATLRSTRARRELLETLEERVRERTALLSNANQQLESRNEDLKRFAFAASHDLKQPLNGIRNLAAWIDEDAGDELAGESRENLDRIHSRVDRMMRLLDDILAYAVIDPADRCTEPLDIEALVEDVDSLVDAPPTFEIRYEGRPLRFAANRAAFFRVLLNFIGNSVKHRSSDEGRCTVRARRDGAVVEVSVEDDGPGIDPRFPDRIFDLFQTIQPKDQSGSSGMGLSFVKRLVEGHGGTISVRSDVEQGAEFLVRWPEAAHVLMKE